MTIVRPSSDGEQAPVYRNGGAISIPFLNFNIEPTLKSHPIASGTIDFALPHNNII